MANANPVFIGQNNLSGATDALFLKVFAGEVLTAFETATVTRALHRVRVIQFGKSATFPATWKLAASYHTPGSEILGQTSPVSERVITVDDMLIAPIFIPEIDEAKNHFDVRSEYTSQAGIALATQWDKNILQLMLLAARASATVTGGFGGASLTSATTLYKTSASDLAAGIYAGVQAMKEKDVMGDASVVMRPAQYYLLAQSTALVNRDWAGENGNYADGKVQRIGGAALIMSNNLPNSVVTTGPTAYQGDFSKTAAVITTTDAVGTVQLLGMDTQMNYDYRRLGTLITAKYAMGHGILRPEAAVELKTTT